MTPTAARRPISRRLMWALFLVMAVPMLGWLFAFTAVAPDTLELGPAQREVWEGLRQAARWRLAAVLALSVVTLGAAVAYVRRSMVSPLERLSARARGAAEGSWSQPEEASRADEIGDLATALDRTIEALRARAADALALAGDLSHELRTPLAAIRGAAEILDDEELGEDERSRFVGNILMEAERLERLVAGLLDMERARHGTPARSAVRDPVDAEELLREVAAACHPLLARRDLRAEIDVAGLSRPIELDRERAQRVLMSLVENALRHAPPATPIRLTAEPRPGGVVFRVGDQGPGVPAELRECIFERRVAGDGSRGSGLGLAIARSLVETGDGAIWVEDGADAGACFGFELPARVGPTPNAPASHEIGSSRQTRNV